MNFFLSNIINLPSDDGSQNEGRGKLRICPGQEKLVSLNQEGSGEAQQLKDKSFTNEDN